MQIRFELCLTCYVPFLRFPEDSLYLSEECWRMIRIGEEPLGFGE